MVRGQLAPPPTEGKGRALLEYLKPKGGGGLPPQTPSPPPNLRENLVWPLLVQTFGFLHPRQLWSATHSGIMPNPLPAPLFSPSILGALGITPTPPVHPPPGGGNRHLAHEQQGVNRKSQAPKKIFVGYTRIQVTVV